MTPTPGLVQQIKHFTECIQTLQTGMTLRSSDKLQTDPDGDGIKLTYALELDSGLRAPVCLSIRKMVTQVYAEVAKDIPLSRGPLAAVAVNAVNQRVAYGKFVLDSATGSVNYLFTQLSEENPGETFCKGIVLMTYSVLNDYLSCLSDFLCSPMDRQDLEALIDEIRVIHREESLDNDQSLAEYFDDEDDE